MPTWGLKLSRDVSPLLASSLHAWRAKPDASSRITLSVVSKLLPAVFRVTRLPDVGMMRYHWPRLAEENPQGVAMIGTLSMVLAMIVELPTCASAPKSRVNWTAPVAPL